MAIKQEERHSIHQRISAILCDGQAGRGFVPPPAPPEEVEEIEYHLARARVDLSAAQARVDEAQARVEALQLELAAKRGQPFQHS